MKKFQVLFYICLALSVGFFTSCNDDEDPLPEPVTNECDGATGFPTATGTATISFVNFPGAGVVETNAAAGDVLSIAVDIRKGDTRPQKLRVYATGCEQKLGTQQAFPDQPQTEDQGKVIDLRNTDNQVRTVLFTVPSGVSPLYLNFEVDESGNKYTYKRLKINVSGSGVIDSYSNIVLGSQNNALPSRMSSSTGYVYLACETEANINTIDLTFAVAAQSSKPYLSSNPARFLAPINLTTTTRDCGTDEGVIRTDGGNAVYFAAPPAGVDFDAATDAELNALVVPTGSQYIEVAAAGVYAFRREDGKKGLVRVDNISANGPGGATDRTIQIDVKVQR